MKKLEEFARTILFGNRLEDKLIAPPPALASLAESPEWTDFRALDEIPSFPGRPKKLSRLGKSDFPRMDQLSDPLARGRILHAFANHELLAMELMALVLLRFPEAPAAFRAGIVRTITEEQNHLRLYIDRMRELGMDFGEQAVNDYFWNCMKDMSSPLQFVTQMSLTFEQANLDFSLQYRDAIAQAGDERTAEILDQVYREEIGHVRHGLVWFNRWREDNPSSPKDETEWKAYQRLLPVPMTPRRAKGQLFSSDARREAGLSEDFIAQLEIYSGSKGRPPSFWFFNPHCDAEIARGKPGFTPSEASARVGLDLEHLPMFLTLETDVVLARKMPRQEWLTELHRQGFKLPEFRPLAPIGALPREEKIAGIEPWGWSPETFARFRPWRKLLVGAERANGMWCSELLERPDFAKSQLGRIYSKTWSAEFYREWLKQFPEDQAIFGTLDTAGIEFRDWEAARATLLGQPPGHWLIKAPWATSGAGNRRLMSHAELEGPIGGWGRRIIETQGSLVIEPWLEKVADLSIQVETTPSGVKLLGARRFLTGSRLEYRGTWLDAKLTSLGAESLRFLHGQGVGGSGVAWPEPLKRWEKLALELGTRLQSAGYQGPAGIDAMLWRNSQGELRLKPLVELNPRWTMGRIAIELEKQILPGTPAVWAFVPAREVQAFGCEDFPALAKALHSRHPLKAAHRGGQPARLIEGMLMTNDPAVAQETLTILAVGPRAVAELTQFKGE